MKLHAIAEQIRANKAAVELEKKKKEEAERREYAEQRAKMFRDEFKEQIPLLDECGITWSVKLKYPNHELSLSVPYIAFEKDGRCLKMDFDRADYYKYGHGAGVYGKWPKEDFILFIDEFFFGENAPIKETYPYPPPTDYKE